jgi:hypothetical protein
LSEAQTEGDSRRSGSDADDRAAVQNTLAEYCHAVDERRFDDFEKLFAEDAVVTARLAGTTYRGPLEIRSYLETQPLEMRGLHVTMNPHILIDGDSASVRSDFLVLVPRGAAAVVGAWGWYYDLLIRQAGRWLFQERRIETQWRLSDIDLAK